MRILDSKIRRVDYIYIKHTKSIQQILVCNKHNVYECIVEREPLEDILYDSKFFRNICFESKQIFTAKAHIFKDYEIITYLNTQYICLKVDDIIFDKKTNIYMFCETGDLEYSFGLKKFISQDLYYFDNSDIKIYY